MYHIKLNKNTMENNLFIDKDIEVGERCYLTYDTHLYSLDEDKLLNLGVDSFMDITTEFIYVESVNETKSIYTDNALNTGYEDYEFNSKIFSVDTKKTYLTDARFLEVDKEHAKYIRETFIKKIEKIKKELDDKL